MVTYSCNKCSYVTKYKTHYFKHMKSQKHLKKNEEEMEREENENSGNRWDLKKVHSQTLTNPHKTLTKPSQNLTNFGDDKKIFCHFCNKKFTRNDNLKRHIDKYCKNKEKMCEFEKNADESEKVKFLSNKVDELEDKVKELEETKKVVNITNTQNINNIKNIDNSRTTNYLNITLPDMLDIDTFIRNLMTTHRLDNEKTALLLESFKTCGLISYGNNLSRTLKENCYQQIKDMEKDSKGIKMIPIVTTDSNLRSYKEKSASGWKKSDSDKRLNDIINISNDQIYKNHKEPIYLDNKDKKKVQNIIKKDHGIGELSKQLEEDKSNTISSINNETDIFCNEENEQKLIEEYINYSENSEDELITYEINEDVNPVFDGESEYRTIIDCGNEFIYDLETNNVFDMDNKKYIGKRVHDENCPFSKHKSNGCWYYVDYK